ncbi:MAG TPA: hypothetical protein EYH34_12080 [Planctomycetes bacterium]|nr:hypothetical protein [Planctomycetota bacterium]
MQANKIGHVVGSLCLVWLTTGTGFAAAERGRSAWWPQFHGPDRTNMAPDTGLLKRWPEGGPRLVWRYGDCGRGFSTVTVAEGKVFTTGDFGDREFIIALDIEGRLLWKAQNGRSWRGPYPGARTIPTYSDGLLYQLNPVGRLAAFRADTGQQVWAVDLVSRYDGRYGTWAMAENVAVDGERVFCVPGGTKAMVAALGKKTGRTVWTNTAIRETAAYCSPVIVTWAGYRQLITLTQKSVISVDLKTGQLLWSYPHVTRHDQNVTMPLFHDGYVLATSGHHGGSTLLKINPDGRGVSEVWSDRQLDNCHGGLMLLDGYLYGSACRSGGKGFFCADFLTGELQWRDKKMRKVSLTWADGMLYALTDRGTVLLMAVSPQGYRVAGQLEVPGGDFGPCLSHPVVCSGRLYVRYDNNLCVYDLRGS